MARIALDPPTTPFARVGEWYARRRFGETMHPWRALAHNPRVLRGNSRAEMAIQKWDAADQHLKNLAVAAAAATVGCSWCMDFGYWISVSQGTDEAKLRALPRWRDSDVYTGLEREVIAYAEAMSVTPQTVTDEMVAALGAELGEAALVELTMMIAVENQRARFNAALGLESQGFADRCELPSVRDLDALGQA